MAIKMFATASTWRSASDAMRGDAMRWRHSDVRQWHRAVSSRRRKAVQFVKLVTFARHSPHRFPMSGLLRMSMIFALCSSCTNGNGLIYLSVILLIILNCKQISK